MPGHAMGAKLAGLQLDPLSGQQDLAAEEDLGHRDVIMVGITGSMVASGAGSWTPSCDRGGDHSHITM